MNKFGRNLILKLFALIVCLFYSCKLNGKIGAVRLKCVWGAETSSKKVIGPRLEFAHESFNAGICSRSQKITHEFKFRNSGDKLLKIKAIKKSCACTTVILSTEEIPPRGRGTIRVDLDSSKSGKQSARIFVISNDPRGEIVLSLSATIKIGVLLNPSIINFGNVRASGSVRRILKVSNVSDRIDKNFEIQNIRSSSALLTARIIEGSRVTRVRDYDGLIADTYDVEVKFEPSGYIGQFEGKLEITVMPDKIFEVPVRASVEGNITILPTETVFFGFVSRANSVSRKLRIINSGDKQLKILNISCLNDKVFTRLHAIEKGKEFELDVSLIRVSSSQKVTDQIIIKTNDTIQPEIRIPVYAFIR